MVSEKHPSSGTKVELDKNPILTRYISKLDKQYNEYKGTYDFESKYEGNKLYLNLSKNVLFNLEFDSKSKLHYVKISFNTPKFEKITKDRAAKFVDILSAIGGTMGLLTGFSIISAVEIAYFAVRIFIGNLFKFNKS